MCIRDSCRIEPPAVVADVTENAFIQIFPINVPCFGIVDVVGAVSYTHLDVYKRQNTNNPDEADAFTSIKNVLIIV